jgi:hypothetical protein
MRREGTISSSTSIVKIPYSIRFEDYRAVDGVLLPFKQINNTPSNGDIVTRITSIKHNVVIDDTFFKSREVKF